MEVEIIDRAGQDEFRHALEKRLNDPPNIGGVRMKPEVQFGAARTVQGSRYIALLIWRP